MYKIEKEDFGYRLTFDGSITKEEMDQWLTESQTALSSAPAEFGVFVDMRTLKPLTPEAQGVLQDGQRAYKENGMTRSVVIVNSKILKMQFTRLAKETGIYEWERYIDSSTISDWEKAGVDWLQTAADPDQLCTTA